MPSNARKNRSARTGWLATRTLLAACLLAGCSLDFEKQAVNLGTDLDALAQDTQDELQVDILDTDLDTRAQDTQAELQVDSPELVDGTDDDECALGTDNCSANATCTNTVGSFTCACNGGFDGDGVDCADVNECDEHTDNCSANATCTNTVGGFRCTSEMVRVPATGTTTSFEMGRPSADAWGDSDEQPVHMVTLDAYWIDKYEVTAAEYKACVDLGVCTAGETSGDYTYDVVGKENHPINGVDWMQAFTYCDWLGRRLPTEAEWERAANGATQRRFPWEDSCPIEWSTTECGSGNWTSTTANANCLDAECHDGYSATSPVGSFPSGVSPEGVHDLAGNVWEWVQDWHDPAYYSTSPAANPTGPVSGTDRVFRGGSWDSVGRNLRVANRGNDTYSNRFDFLGFRCASSVP